MDSKKLRKKIYEFRKLINELNEKLSYNSENSENNKALKSLIQQKLINKNIIEFLKELYEVENLINLNLINPEEIEIIYNKIIEYKNYIYMKFYHYL